MQLSSYLTSKYFKISAFLILLIAGISFGANHAEAFVPTGTQVANSGCYGRDLCYFHSSGISTVYDMDGNHLFDFTTFDFSSWPTYCVNTTSCASGYYGAEHMVVGEDYYIQLDSSHYAVFQHNNESGTNGSDSDIYPYSYTPAPPVDTTTHIISFTPDNGTTTASTTVNFTYHIYVNADDIGFWSGKSLYFSVQHQPIGIENVFLDNVSATTSGDFSYSTTTVLTPGNYIVNACITPSYIDGIIVNSLVGCQYHQFVVASSSFVGNLFQNGINSVQDQLNNISATSSYNTLENYCNPFSGFDIVQCFYALFIPTSSQLNDTMTSFYSDFLLRVPWGYASLVIKDLTAYGSVATSSLSSSNLTITLPNNGAFATATSTAALRGQTITFIDWNQIASSSRNNYWGSGMTALNNFFNILFGGAFAFWLFRFFKNKMNP